MDRYAQIYASHAAAYQRLTEAEDVDGNLLPAIQNALSLADKDVLDLGSGTGRLPLLCREQGARFIALDSQWAMLAEQRRLRDEAGASWPLAQGDFNTLPLASDSFDIVMAGWSIGHTTEWHATDWPARVARIVAEMRRVVRTPGALLILETLGTASLAPAPPVPALADYYARLEGQWKFERTVVRTDYYFASPEDAYQQIASFFGPELGELVRRNNWTRVPEWTGLWVRRFGPS